MKRREFLRYSKAGAVTVALGGAGLIWSGAHWSRPSQAATVDHVLSIEKVTVELVDGKQVFMWAFKDATNGPRVPGSILRVQEGETVSITVTNNADEPHQFAITGIAGSETRLLSSGETDTVMFTAPSAGSYMYLDPSNEEVNRVLGLHGAFVVMPDAGSSTPYGSGATGAVLSLFGALGSDPEGDARFPGDKWNPDDPERERVWVFNQIDPAFNAMAEAGQTIDPAAMRASFVPRYFTINGLSGLDATFDPDTLPRGFEGQPALMRVLNAGLATHSPHIHGNHIFELATSDPGTGVVVVNENVIETSTWTMPAGGRKDVLLPFEKPPDIPAAAWPPKEEPFPMRFPMHCHFELSQTAGGGDYPQGLITDWELEGDLSAREG